MPFADGDALSAVFGLYFLYLAFLFGCPWPTLGWMLVNIVVVRAIRPGGNEVFLADAHSGGTLRTSSSASSREARLAHCTVALC
jgi:hypothetical protein